MAKNGFAVEVAFQNCSINFIVLSLKILSLKMKWIYSFQYLFYHVFLYVADMIAVLEVTLMVPSFPQ